MMNDTYLVGSRLLMLDNCRDTDYIYFDGIKQSSGNNCCYIKMNLPHVELILSQMGNPAKTLRSFNFPVCNYYYQFSSCFQPDDFPIKWDIRDNKEAWKTLLKQHISNQKAVDKYINPSEGLCKKPLYNIAYQYFMIVDDAVWLSGEHKQIVQKIHDLEMPSDYFYELKEKILAL